MKLIQTKDYLLLIDEEAEIKEADLVYEEELDVIFDIQPYGLPCNNIKTSKIIAYYSLNSEAEELDLPLLPPFPVVSKIDIQGMAIEKYGDNYWSVDRLTAFEDGYKAAQSKQLELLKRAIYLASDAENIEEVTEEIIQSLSTQQLPKEFIPETEVDPTNPKNWYEDCPSGKYWEDEPVPPSPNNLYTNGTRRLKTITNSEGKEVIQGEWIY